MKNTPDRFAGAFAIFFTAAFPFICGSLALLSHRFFLDAIADRRAHAGVLSDKIPPFANFALNNVHGMLWALFAVTLLFAGLSFLQCRVQNPVARLSCQFVIAFASALTGLAFLAFFLIGCVHAVPPFAS